MFNLVSFIMTLPGSSAFSERIFSMMNIKWRDERSRCSKELIEAELIVSVNSCEDCTSFFRQCTTNQNLLDKAVSTAKYSKSNYHNDELNNSQNDLTRPSCSNIVLIALSVINIFLMIFCLIPFN